MNIDLTYDIEQYPQIAYGINGMYQGIKRLTELTGNPDYENYSQQVYDWFSGKNIALEPMYNDNSALLAM